MTRRRVGAPVLARLLAGAALVALSAPFTVTAPVTAAPAIRCTTPSQQLLPEVPWTHRRLAPQRVWPLTRGDGVLVAVVDTGVDGAVPQLAGRVRRGVDVLTRGAFADDDCYGHGTFVAGIIAAQPAPGTGMVGLAPGARILPVRQAYGPTDGTTSGLARAIRAAVDGGASVINVSASSFFPSDELRQAVEYAAEQDVLVVAAVANEAQQGNPTAYPAAYPEVLAVGAIGPDGRRSEFSEVGSYLDLVAPGVDVVSLSRGGIGHLVDSGTSYATPFVAATAALVRSYHPNLTAAQVKRRLERTADHPGGKLPDPQVGWGVVNPYQAVTAILAEEHTRLAAPAGQPPIPPVAPPGGGPDHRSSAIEFSVTAAVLAGLVALLAYLIPLGTRRDWRSVGDSGDAPARDGRAG
ncbi:type VII secretion-associated serine protease mycosin [Micromonospora echinofusca]|uniref:type VII secretion-associated serine protease mycosin n=1 Tax=Micromonospora echinofusca TaxID=47858 RepID=UPI0027DD5FB9|nr:type VII secretion-associated serine protease mycosin [Micromonospora echinofusca]